MARNILTIFSDASFCSETKTAGWGAWCKNDYKTVNDFGYYNCEIIDASEAEIAAVAKAIKLAFSNQMINDKTKIIIQSDNQRAVDIVNRSRVQNRLRKNKIRLRTNLETKIYFYLRKLNEKINIEARHVKGHCRGENKRSYVNELCDNLANKGRIEAQSQKQIGA